jgi:hypothetical protein
VAIVNGLLSKTSIEEASQTDSAMGFFCAQPSICERPLGFNPAAAVLVVPSIFEPFLATKSFATGLGLAIAHNIARLHTSSLPLTANSAEPFRFTLKLARVAAFTRDVEETSKVQSPWAES